MDFRQLESFIAIAKNKSFSKAARELYLTQPTLSNHMQNLEKELGTFLLNRTNREISLTRAGEIFYDYAQKILSLKDTAQYNLGEYVGKIEGTQFMKCKLYTNENIVIIMMNEFDYERLKEEGIFIRDGKSRDSAGVLNTTNTFIEKN